MSNFQTKIKGNPGCCIDNGESLRLDQNQRVDIATKRVVARKDHEVGKEPIIITIIRGSNRRDGPNRDTSKMGVARPWGNSRLQYIFLCQVSI